MCATLAYAAAINPALQTSYAKDPEFSGSFFFDDLHEIAKPEAFSAVTKYMMITKNRAGCRSTVSGWTAPPTVDIPEPTGGASLPTGLPVTANGLGNEMTEMADYRKYINFLLKSGFIHVLDLQFSIFCFTTT